MFEPLRICIAGAGAIGGTLAVRMANAGHDVTMLARGATLATLQRDGVTLHDQHGTTHARPRAEEEASFGVQDVIFICVKSQDVADMVEQVAPLIGPDTLVVPAVNGVPWWYFYREGGRFDGSPVMSVDPLGRIDAALLASHVIGSVLFITAEVTAPGVIVSGNPHRVMLGEPDGAMSPRLLRLCAAMEHAGIATQATDRIRDKLWSKIIANISTNPLSVLTQATLEQIYGDTELSGVVTQVMHEVSLVASCYGARLEFDPVQYLEQGKRMGPFRTSMLQDLERGRPLELSAIGDAVMELADRYDLPMPITRAVIGLARFRGAAAMADKLEHHA